MTERLDVDTHAQLLAFLRQSLDCWRVKTLKERLRLGCVRVNGETVTLHNHPLEPGDRVEVGSQEAGTFARIRPPFTTLYEDDDLIAIDKPAGLLSVSNERQRSRTALTLLRDSLSRPGRPARLWPAHRLDRETSGVLLFARSREVRDALQTSWTEARKIYLAIVDGHPVPAEGTVNQPLWEDRTLNVHVGRRPDAKDARTRYRTCESGPHRTLLNVELLTGRRHQIRSHLAWLGYPVVGDRRYGSAGPRMGLHALRLHITHPRGREPIAFVAPPPRAFSALLRSGR